MLDFTAGHRVILFAKEVTAPMAEERVLTRKELFDLVWSTPMQHLAREFKLSDVGLAKTCKRYAIPRPERGYWAKLAVGKAPKQPKLPLTPAGVGDEVRFTLHEDPPPRPEPVVSPEVASWIERERASKIVVAEHVGKYHPLVRRAKDALEAKREWHGPDDGWRSSGLESFSIRVTKPHIARACRIAHALVSAMEQRKFTIEYSREHRTTIVHALKEEFKVSLVERQKRVTHVPTPDELRREKQGQGWMPKFDNIPCGLLRLTVECGYRKLQIEDSDRRRIDEQLNDVMLWIVTTVIDVLRPAAVRRRIEEEQRREGEHKRWVYQQKCERFDAVFRAWSAQQERLRFVAVLEETLGADAPEDVRSFVAWTRRYVEAADPLPKFFAALAKNETVYYHEFTRRY